MRDYSPSRILMSSIFPSAKVWWSALEKCTPLKSSSKPHFDVRKADIQILFQSLITVRYLFSGADAGADDRNLFHTYLFLRGVGDDLTILYLPAGDPVVCLKGI